MNKAASNARLKASLEELARFGCPVDSSVAITAVGNEKVEIEQVGGIHESHIFQLHDGRVAFMAYIAVTNQVTRTIDLIDVELKLPWDNVPISWLLPDEVNLHTRAKQDCRSFIYQFPGERGLQLEYSQVINRLLVERRKLPGKRRLEGWLLGTGCLMPPRIRHGEWLDLPLTIVGSDHAEYSTILRIWTEHLHPRTKIVKKRTPMFPRPLEEEVTVAPDLTRTTPPPAGQAESIRC